MKKQFRTTRLDGTLDPLTAIKVDAIAYYPSEVKSVMQAFQLFETEKINHMADPQHWQFSALSMDVLNAAMKRSAQVYVCGIVALLMAHLDPDGKKTSLNQATKVASEIFNNMDKATFIVPKTRNWEQQDKSIVGDPQTIKRYFRQYRSAAHICAARVLIGSSGNGHPLLVPLPQTLSYLSTVLHYQRVFSAWPEGNKWDMWQIWYEGESFEENYAPVQPQEQQLALVRDIHRKVKNGVELTEGDFQLPPGGT